jgi:hypothetical protein
LEEDYQRVLQKLHKGFWFESKLGYKQ